MPRKTKRAAVDAGPVEGPWALPEGWRWERLSSLTDELFSGRRPKGGVDGSTVGPLSLGGEHLTWEGRLRLDRPKRIPAAFSKTIQPYRVAEGDILIVKDGATTGKCAFVERLAEEAYINEHVFAVRPTAEIERKLLFYWLWSEVGFRQIMQDFRGAAQGGIGRTFVDKVIVPVPPPDVQRAMVARIDELFAESDAGDLSLRAASTSITSYRRSLLKAAVSGWLTVDWRRSNPPSIPSSVAAQKVLAARRAYATQIGARKYVEPVKIDTDSLGDLPDGWSWMSLDEVSSPEERSFQSGPFGSSLLHSEFQDAGKLVIGIDNVRDGYFSIGSDHRISEEKFDELRRFSARPRDLLITVMATIGRVCVVPEDVEDAIITKHLYRISCFAGAIDPDYLSLVMRGRPEARLEIFGKAQGQTRPGLNKTILQKVPVPVPPLEEQREILARLAALQADTDGASAGVESLHAASSQLRQSILAAAFRGDLVA